MIGFDKPRYELKFVLDLETYSAFSKVLMAHFTFDHHIPEGQNHYQVNSLYYDTPEFADYYQKIDGVDPRQKLRLRSYGSSMEGPYVVEVKSRQGPLVKKSRLKISGVISRFHNASAITPDLVRNECFGSGDSMNAVIGMISLRQMQPVVSVHYKRQALMTHVDEGIRVTFDRDLTWRHPEGFWQPSEKRERFLPRHLGVLEIKFYWSMPHWLEDIVNSFGLEQRRYSKYASALEALHPSLTVRGLRVAADGAFTP